VEGALLPLGRTSFLLELLHFAGWRLEVRRGETARIRATRADVELDVRGASLDEAAEAVFARAMRSSTTRKRGPSRAARSAGRKRPHRSSA
jgi:hypothetical protein